MRNRQSRSKRDNPAWQRVALANETADWSIVGSAMDRVRQCLFGASTTVLVKTSAFALQERGFHFMDLGLREI